MSVELADGLGLPVASRWLSMVARPVTERAAAGVAQTGPGPTGCSGDLVARAGASPGAYPAYQIF